MSSSSASPSGDGAIGREAKRARRETTAGAPPAVTEEQPPAWALALQSSLAQMQQMQAQMQAQIEAARASTQARIDAMAAQLTAQGAALVARFDSMERVP
jgi:formate dehydrogenase maturation protein FdhE